MSDPGRDPRPVAFRGELATRRILLARALALASPALAWLALLLAVPLLLVVVVACCRRGDYGQIEWSFTLENLGRAVGVGTPSTTVQLGPWSIPIPDTILIVLRTLGIAAGTTAACIVLALPLALVIATRGPRVRAFGLAAVMVPFCTNVVIRTYGWKLLLAGRGPVVALLAQLGLAEPGVALFPSALAVWTALVAASLPFAVAPLYAVVEKLDWSLVEAARDLYGGRLRVLRHAILPQIAGGLGAATILTFVPALGVFVIPDMLGGAKQMLIGNLVQQQLARDWPYGAALGVWLVVATLVALRLARRVRIQASA